MGKIYYVMGKSASGKDTIYNRLLEECPRMKKLILYTTRPIREGEEDGREYHFITDQELAQMEAEGRIIEKRTYHTIYGPWTYATVDDHRVNLERRNYIAIGTLESYAAIRDHYGQENVVPLFIQLDDGIRLQRALNREMQQAQPKYAEMCRRFLADEQDFSEDRIYEAGITRRYVNEDLNKCVAEIRRDMGEDV